MNALNVLCAKLTRDLFAIGKFLVLYVCVFLQVYGYVCVDTDFSRLKQIKTVVVTKSV